MLADSLAAVLELDDALGRHAVGAGQVDDQRNDGAGAGTVRGSSPGRRRPACGCAWRRIDADGAHRGVLHLVVVAGDDGLEPGLEAA